ncbi:MAG: cofactor assembly of complex C subunit B [Cyanobacteria bacterium P01_E01_bin.48]
MILENAFSLTALTLAIALNESGIEASRSQIFTDVPTISAMVWTVLLSIGLFFFIRASGKDRTEQRRWYSQLAVEEMGRELRRYLQQRAYQLVGTDEAGIATFTGRAQPSGFLTVLLSLLAAVGLICLAVVLNALLPAQWQGAAYTIVLAAPLAGWYYRAKSAREETVRLKVEAAEAGDRACQIAISGHRDELDAMAAQLPLKEAWE